MVDFIGTQPQHPPGGPRKVLSEGGDVFKHLGRSFGADLCLVGVFALNLSSNLAAIVACSWGFSPGNQAPNTKTVSRS